MPCGLYGCGRTVVYYSCPIHGIVNEAGDACTCQYGADTPKWYQSVRGCLVHGAEYNPTLAPGWAKAEPDLYGLPIGC